MTKEKTRYKYGDIIIRERKGRYYVYRLETKNGEIKERYVGPLTDVVETYEKLKESNGNGVLEVSPNMGPPGFEPGTTSVLEDSLERRKATLVANLRQYLTPGNIKAFYEYLLNERKVTEYTAKKYILELNKPYRDTAVAQKAYRLLAKFLASRGIISEDFEEKILKLIKVKRANADIYIPSVEEIKKTLQIAKEYSENVYFIYRIALESGARMSEVLKVLREPEKDICEEKVCYYPLNWTRGYKGSFYIFHITSLKRVNVTEWAVNSFEKKHKDAVNIKYFRKFVATKMAELGIPLDIIDFIQGRKPTRILTQHYVSLFGIAKEHYKKYAEWLRQNIYQTLT